jgi:hypothetical protein
VSARFIGIPERRLSEHEGNPYNLIVMRQPRSKVGLDGRRALFAIAAIATAVTLRTQMITTGIFCAIDAEIVGRLATDAAS